MRRPETMRRRDFERASFSRGCSRGKRYSERRNPNTRRRMRERLHGAD